MCIFLKSAYFSVYFSEVCVRPSSVTHLDAINKAGANGARAVVRSSRALCQSSSHSSAMELD